MRSKIAKIRAEGNIPAVVRLGRNIYRQISLMYILRDGGGSFSEISGVPAIQGNSTENIEIFLESAKASQLEFD